LASSSDAQADGAAHDIDRRPNGEVSAEQGQLLTDALAVIGSGAGGLPLDGGRGGVAGTAAEHLSKRCGVGLGLSGGRIVIFDMLCAAGEAKVCDKRSELYNLDGVCCKAKDCDKRSELYNLEGVCWRGVVMGESAGALAKRGESVLITGGRSACTRRSIRGGRSAGIGRPTEIGLAETRRSTEIGRGCTILAKDLLDLQVAGESQTP